MALSGIFSSLFDRKPRIDHPTASKRLEALATLDDSRQEAFLNLAQNDADLEVRRAAVNRVRSPENLARFLEDDDLRDIVTETICEEIDINHDLMEHSHIRSIMLERLTDGKQLGTLAKRLKSNEEVAAAILAGGTPDIRKDAICQIGSNEVLNLCERITRHKDKTLNRFIRDRVASRKKLASQQQDCLSRAEQLIDSTSRADPTSAVYASLRDAQERNWESLLSEMTEINSQLTELGVEGLDLDMLRSRFPKRTQTASLETTGGLHFAQILRKLREEDPSVEAVNRAEQEWLEALKSDAAPIELSNEFFELIGEIRHDLRQHEVQANLQPLFESLMSKQEPTLPDLSNKGSWPRVWQNRQDARNQIRQTTRFLKHPDFKRLDRSVRDEWTQVVEGRITQCEELINKADELFDKTMDEIAEKVEDVKQAVDSGKTKSASQLDRHVRNLIHRLPAPARRRPMDMLAPVSAELHNLLNWKQFATEPKRDELLAQIQALRDSPLEPQQQHEQIRSLRTAWNSLGTAVTSEEIGLQKQYDEAAEAAFQVCKDWYEEQNKVRSRNTDLKEDIAKELERLFEATDWENTEWDTVIKQLRRRRSQYEDIHQVDRSRIRAVNKRFYAAHGAIRQKVQEHQAEVANRKAELIEKARQVTGDESLDQQAQVAAIKSIQAEWRDIGTTFYKKEEVLWQEFREVCNELFENRRLAYEKRKESIDTNIDDATKIVERLLSKAKKNPQNLDHNEFNEVSSKIAEMYLPKRIQLVLEKKLDQVEGLLEGKREFVKQIAVRDRLAALLDRDTELAGFESENSAIPEEWFDAVQSDSVLFETRVPMEEDLQRKELEDLILRAEIKADIEPQNSSEQDRRLELKVSELSETMGSGEAPPRVVAEKLIGEWVAVAHGHTELRERFHAAMHVILDRIGD